MQNLAKRVYPVYNPSVSGKKRKVKRHLTSRQRAFIRHLAAGKSQKKAAIAAGYSPKNPDQSAAQALNAIRNTLPEILIRSGLDDDTVIKNHLVSLMNADQTKFFSLPVGRGKTRTLQIHTRKTANRNARATGLDIFCKIRGLYVREAENKGPEFSVVIIDSANRPDWGAMRRAHPKIEVPGLNALPNEE